MPNCPVEKTDFYFQEYVKVVGVESAPWCSNLSRSLGVHVETIDRSRFGFGTAPKQIGGDPKLQHIVSGNELLLLSVTCLSSVISKRAHTWASRPLREACGSSPSL